MRLASTAGGRVEYDYSFPKDEWHHVAAVAMMAEHGPTILLYVDGQLEIATRSTRRAFETVTEHDLSEPIRFGRQIYWEDAFYRGALDEIYLFDAALTGDQVRQLMEAQPTKPATSK